MSVNILQISFENEIKLDHNWGCDIGSFSTKRKTILFHLISHGFLEMYVARKHHYYELNF
jgi:hypothetical protein